MSRYIDADYLQDRLQDFSEWCRDGRKQGVDFVLASPLPNTPTADVAPVVHAHWVDITLSYSKLDKDGCTKSSAWCSNCGKWLVASDGYHCTGYYCPNCGAKMDEKEENETPV